MELASGLNKFFEVTFSDTNRFIGKKLLSKEAIEKKLKGVKREGQLNNAVLTWLDLSD